MRRHRTSLLLTTLVALSIIGGVSCARRRPPANDDAQTPVHRPPNIRPDYTGSVIPPNIAPLNFLIREPGASYRVRFQGPPTATSAAFDVFSDAPRITIPARRWRALLQACRGGELRFEISVSDESGNWRRFEAITNRVARDEIDGYLAYRKIKPLYNYWHSIGVYQRDLGSYDEWCVMHGRYYADGCLNCHTFHDNRTDKMTLGIRSGTHGSSTLLAQNGAVTKIGTKWGYTSWHPSGRLTAYSLNKVRQFFHSAGIEVRDVVDLDSDLVIYLVDSNTVETADAIADPDRLETYPTWSPDGRHLYFCSAPFPWTRRDKMPPKNYEQVRYDLRRVAYDIDTGDWGDAETVLSADDTGRSILLPRISPDGRFLLMCMCKYGCFPIYQPTSDLYMMDIQTGEHRRLDINSDRSESWHSWSSNGRWIAFSSKRRDGLFTRSYISHVDESGEVSKPFILPQKDPTFYDSCLQTYTVPELVTERVKTTPRAMARAIRSSHMLEVQMPDVSMTRKAKEEPAGDAWQQDAQGEGQEGHGAPDAGWRPAR